MRETEERKRAEIAARTMPVVLLVEDEAVVREITGRVLENAGYHVLEARSASAALRLAAQHAEFDLLLTDVVMPEMNGIELADRISTFKPDLVTVFMSGYAERDMQRKIAERSAVHIQKPFTISLLLSRVAEALGAKPSPDSGAAGSANTKYQPN